MFEIELDEGPPPKNTLKLPYNRTSKYYDIEAAWTCI